MYRTATLFLTIILFGFTVLAADVDPRFALELSAWDADVSSGPFRPPEGIAGNDVKAWSSEDDGWSLAEFRLQVPMGRYALFVQAERMSDLEGRATWTYFDTGSGSVVPYQRHVTRTASMEAFDLALGRAFEPTGGLTLTPWVGATHLRGELHEMVSDMDQGFIVPGGEEQRLLGITGGIEARWRIIDNLHIGGRLMARWAGGSSDVQRSHVAETTGVYAVVSYTTEQAWRLMYGAELGVDWSPLPYLSLGGGWRLRNWSYDGGPAREEGPFLRLGTSF